MPKFFVSPSDVQDNFLVLTGENAAHAKVLRLQCGETVTVCDGAGQDLTCVVSDASPGQISLVVQRREASRGAAGRVQRLYGLCEGGQAGACDPEGNGAWRDRDRGLPVEPVRITSG